MKESTATTTLIMKSLKSLKKVQQKRTDKSESDSEPESKSESEFESVVKKCLDKIIIFMSKKLFIPRNVQIKLLHSNRM